MGTRYGDEEEDSPPAHVTVSLEGRKYYMVRPSLLLWAVGAAAAQLVYTQKVTSSNLVPPTTICAISSVGQSRSLLNLRS